MQKMKNRVIVITGGTSGIGKAVADLAATCGDTVIVLGRTAKQDGARSWACDVSDQDAVKETFRQIGERFGKIDVLINSAGFGMSGASELTETETAKRMFDVNYFGLLFSTQAALPWMGRGGKILNISSCCGLFIMPFRAQYSASKAAVNMLSWGMRMELKASGIDVCAVCPGDIKTNFIQNRVESVATNDRYGDRVQNATDYVAKRNDKRMSAVYAAKQIVRLCDKRRCKPTVIIGQKYKLFHFLTKLFPFSAYLHISDKLFGGHR